MLVHLDLTWDDKTLERFALIVAQQSFHLALQLTWMLIGFMEDYQEEDSIGEKNPNADIKLYNRCAAMLEKLELSVVFGSPLRNEFGALCNDGSLSKEEIMEMELAHRKFQAMRIATAPRKRVEYEIEGNLEYKRWHSRSLFHSKTWIKRTFVIKQRVLYCFRLSDNMIKRSIPLQDCEVLVPEVGKHGKPFYFELKEKDRERTYMLAAKSKEDMDNWTSSLRMAINSPPAKLITSDDPSHSSAVACSSLSPTQLARYGFFRSQREFVHSITDICEELRFVNRADRQIMLQKKMVGLRIPGCVYMPLCCSTDPWERIVATIPEECHAFSTKERCPCLIAFELEGVRDEAGRSEDVSSYLFQTLGLDSFALNECDDGNIPRLEKSGSVESFESENTDFRNRSEFVQSARKAVEGFDVTRPKETSIERRSYDSTKDY